MSTNYALALYGSTATASSTFSGYSPSAVINGLRHTNSDLNGNANAWANNADFPSWVEIDFGRMRKINHVEIYGQATGIYNSSDPNLYEITTRANEDFKVQFWDGVKWIDIADVTGNDRLRRVFDFHPVITRKVRVYITSAADGYARLVEIEVWGSDEPKVFPLEFSRLTSGTEFSTIINEGSVSGYEQRIKQRGRAKDRFDGTLAIQCIADARMLRDFFLACGGRHEIFLLLDPSDHTFDRTNTLLNGNGSLKDFQIRKLYSDYMGNNYYRDVTKPIRDTISVLVNGVSMTENTDFVIDYTTGIISFETAPASGQAIVVEGEFYKNCRFDTDILDQQILEYWAANDEYALVRSGGVPILEVI